MELLAKLAYLFQCRLGCLLYICRLVLVLATCSLKSSGRIPTPDGRGASLLSAERYDSCSFGGGGRPGCAGYLRS